MGFSSEMAESVEDGEIIEVIEYEEISSDEEFNLRQRIGELEELEKIARISSSKANEYGKYQKSFVICLRATSRMAMRISFGHDSVKIHFV